MKVAVVRRGKTEPQEISITRQIIGPQHIVADRVGDDVAYIRLPAIDPMDVAELHDKLVQLDKQGVHKLVLDLRDCTRGAVPDAIAAAQLFLSSGKITSLEGQTVAHKDYTAAADKAVWNAPVDVLISPSTSGAAEVLAGAIKGNKRGDLVGERTFGSASEQKIIPLDDGGAVILTVAFYATPDGKSIVDEGVAPTVEVHPKPADPSASPLTRKIPRRWVPGKYRRRRMIRFTTRRWTCLRAARPPRPRKVWIADRGGHADKLRGVLLPLHFFILAVLGIALFCVAGCKTRTTPLTAAAIRGITREFVFCRAQRQRRTC